MGSAQIGGTANVSHGFLWDPVVGELFDVGRGQLTSINDGGMAVGSSQDGPPMPQSDGVLYFNGIRWNLNDLIQEPNTHLGGAAFVNSRGQIIGVGFVHNQWADYLLTPRD